jgi:hypothetical protein
VRRAWTLAIVAGCGFEVPGAALAVDADAVDGERAVDASDPDAAMIDAMPLGPFGNVSPIAPLNTGFFEDDPTLTGDLLEIYFERGAEIYVSTRAAVTSAWPAAQPLTVVNTGATETTTEITADGLELFFSSNRSGGAGGFDVYVTTRPNRAAAFGNPQRVMELSSTGDDVCPTVVDPTALVMYVSSTRPGGVGGYDIYRTTRPNRLAAWAAPVLVPSLSTTGTDTEPWVDPTETTIYLSADGAGIRDIYLSTRANASATWETPTAVMEVNSNGSEEDPWLSIDGHTLFFSSSRSGNYELYTATR